jgi:hypothetical protein
LLRSYELGTQIKVLTSIPNVSMQHSIKIARGLASPAILIAAVWCAALIGVAIGPVEYPLQPSIPVLALVAIGVSLFILGYLGGAWCFRTGLRQRPNLPAPTVRMLNVAVATTSMVGVAGIALMALDRLVLSGISNGGYAELLRCAPDLVNFIEVKRTPLIYVGYLTFSFGFASLVLFLLKGEEIRGWPAILAQLSILCPVGYALLYSGRMPILFIVVLVIAIMLVRVGQGRRPLPPGHHLLIKTIAVLVLFSIYTNAIWSSRRNFCIQMDGLIKELLVKAREQESEQSRALQMRQAELKQTLASQSGPVEPQKRQATDSRPAQPSNDVGRGAEQAKEARDIQQQLTSVQQELAQPHQPQSAETISAADLSKRIDETKALSGDGDRAHSADVDALLVTMQEAWHAKPRAYVVSAIESGRLSPDAAVNLLSSYFYLTHGIGMLDLVWHARTRFSPHWGLYEIGILSPILRVFFPQNQLLASMSMQLKSAEVYGFFPTVWAAAYIDFGAVGVVVYILIWGFAAGWSAYGARHSVLAMPPLLLTFILASILLSPVQGPLGIANSALVLVSLLIVGLVIDLGSVSAGSKQQYRGLQSGTLA